MRQLEVTTDCEDIFTNDSIGGLGLALTHGSVLFKTRMNKLNVTPIK